MRLGPPLFGLPYRLGRIEYRHVHEIGRYSGCVSDARTRSELRYEGHWRA
ncbi:MAG TPA: hypothetical protein PLH97_06575 [Verrucomicrobiota bacterium]|nr:hypothetical protein [Verrucomicrobiota bacterium]HPU55928.1 hypothetical protein [Verrucomicrobiota bacterium]